VGGKNEGKKERKNHLSEGASGMAVRKDRGVVAW
jgi:hypothetical protein